MGPSVNGVPTAKCNRISRPGSGIPSSWSAAVYAVKSLHLAAIHKQIWIGCPRLINDLRFAFQMANAVEEALSAGAALKLWHSSWLPPGLSPVPTIYSMSFKQWFEHEEKKLAGDVIPEAEQIVQIVAAASTQGIRRQELGKALPKLSHETLDDLLMALAGSGQISMVASGDDVVIRAGI